MVIAQGVQPIEKQGKVVPSYETFDLDIERFGVAPAQSPEEVSVGVAVSLEDQIGRLRVVTDRYQAENYLEGIQSVDIPQGCTIEDILSISGIDVLAEILAPMQLRAFWDHGIVFNTAHGPLYVDRYFWSSIPIVAKSITPEGEDMFLGSARIILCNGNMVHSSLPIFDDPTIKLYDDGALVASGVDPSDVKGTIAEFSQFAKAERLRGNHRNAANAVLRSAYCVSNSIGIGKWLATIDSKVVRVLNGFYIFQLPKIGEPVDYLGSMSEPVLIVTESALNNATNSSQATDTSRAIARFIRGEENPEWYRGV